jgi:hypothetical protein
LQIRRFLSLNEPQFLGCTSAFLDALDSEMQSAQAYLQRLVNQSKGRAFGFEMQLDKHRYGSLIVLERWAEFGSAFASTGMLGELQPLLEQARARATSAAGLIEKMNAMVDAADFYSPELIEACGMTFHAVGNIFRDEREAVQRLHALGAEPPEDFRHYRSVFTGDLAVR